MFPKNVTSVESNSSYLVWDASGALLRTPLSGGATQQISVVYKQLGLLALDDEFVYFYYNQSGNSHIARVPILGGETTFLAPIASGFVVNDIALNGDYLYWIGFDTATKAVWRVAVR